jgi:hypothetical protein
VGEPRLAHAIAVPTRCGSGYWSRNVHELLLAGTRDDTPDLSPSPQAPIFRRPAWGEPTFRVTTDRPRCIHLSHGA